MVSRDSCAAGFPVREFIVLCDKIRSEAAFSEGRLLGERTLALVIGTWKPRRWEGDFLVHKTHCRHSYDAHHWNTGKL